MSRYWLEGKIYNSRRERREIVYRIMLKGFVIGILSAFAVNNGCSYYKTNFTKKNLERVKESQLETETLEPAKKLLQE